MSFGLYKPGQGYWTRVMTAIGAGLLAVTGAQWLAGQLQGIETRFDPNYFKASIAGATVLLAAALIFWVVGAKKKTVEFFIATEGEMQKVNWSTRREVFGSTWVVIGVSFIITAVLFATDILFSRFFQYINLLEK